MRRTSVARPFAGGYRSDVPDYALEENQTAFAQDLNAPIGIAQQRRGWEYRGIATVPYATYGLTGVARTRYPITERNRTVVCADNGKVYVTDQDGTQILLWNNPTNRSTYFVPRCVYNGDLILCAQDGETPLMRYAGSLLAYGTTGAYPNGSMVNTSNPLPTYTIAAGSQSVTSSAAITSPTTIDIGSFITFLPFDTSGAINLNPLMHARLLQTNGSTTFSFETIRNIGSVAATSSGQQFRALPVGFTWPAVPIYEQGKVTVSGTSATFTGADMVGSGVQADQYFCGDALLVLNPANATTGDPHQITQISQVNSSTLLTLSSGGTLSDAAYKILRRCPFKDAAVHRGSLWGTGVRQYPSRVYVFGPTDDISLPPGAEKPYDSTKQAGYSSAAVTGFTRVSDYVCGQYDVPGPYDTSPNVAILSSSGPLLVLKADSVYGIYGTYDQSNPSAVEVTRIADSSGCIDMRSAITSGSIPYWAGEDGIFTYQGGVIRSLTEGKIAREWQVLMRAYVPGTSWVSSGVVGSYLIVSCGGLDTSRTSDAMIGTDTVAPDSRTFVYDTRSNVWLGRMTNFNPRHMWAVEFNNIPSSLYSVDDDSPGRVIDAAPAYINGANPIDENNLGPRLKAWSRTSLPQADGVEGEARFCDLMMHTNIYDVTTPTTQLDISVTTGGSLNEAPSATKTLTSIYADTTDRIDRSKRMINQSGRLQQIKIDMSVTDATNKKTEIPELVMSFRDSRRGT